MRTSVLGAALALGLPLDELELQGRYFLARAHEAAGNAAQAFDVYLQVVASGAGSAYGDDAATRSLTMKLEADRTSRPGAGPTKKAAPKKKAAGKKTAAKAQAPAKKPA